MTAAPLLWALMRAYVLGVLTGLLPWVVRAVVDSWRYRR